MKARWHDAGWGRRLKLLLFMLVPALVLLAVAETCATLTIARVVRTDTTESGFVYRMRIGRLPWGRVTTTPLNSLGFPDTEFTVPDSADRCVRFAFLGDSFVFGDGVDRDSNFVEIVRRTLEARAPRCVRVFNLGRRGTSILRQSDILAELQGRIQPDVVVLAQYQNDLTDLTHELRADSGRPVQRTPDRVRDRLVLPNLNLPRWISYRAFAFMIRHDISYDLLSYWSVMADSTQLDEAERLMGVYRARFDSLATALGRRGIALGVVVIPSKFDVLAGRFPEEPFFASLAEERGVPRLLIFPVLDRNRSPNPFLLYDGHLNEIGNRLLAAAISSWILDSVPAPFPVLRTTDP